MPFGTCKRCKGTGKRNGKTCRTCSGSGESFKEKGADEVSIYVRVDVLQEIYRCDRICDGGYTDCPFHKDCKRIKRIVEILMKG